VPLLEPQPAPTEAAHAQALQLLERHGVVTREGVRAEGTAGGFAGVYPVLKALEESGKARRGWFVAGLGAAQFALPGAVDRLRAHRTIDEEDHARVLVLAATDPAQPYGAALSWPEHNGSGRPARATGAFVVLVDGECAAYLERGGKSLLTFHTPVEEFAEAIVAAHKEGRLGRVQIERINDEPARTSPAADALRNAGFANGYKGLTLPN
jgi:ATP-dependent Lhr-like helicase